MAYKFDGSTSYLELATLPLQIPKAVPLTLACRNRLLAAPTTYTVISLSNKASVSGDYFGIQHINGQMRGARSFAGGTAASALVAATAGISKLGGWYSCVGMFRSSTSRIGVASFDGRYVIGAENATASTPAAPDTLNIGANYVNSALQNFSNALFADAAIWNIDLSIAEAAAYCSGVSPLLIRPQNLVLYLPLDRDISDRSFSRVVLTNTAAVPVSDITIPVKQAARRRAGNAAPAVFVQSPLLQPIMPVLQRREMATGFRGTGPFVGAGPSAPLPPPPDPPALIPGVQLQPIMPQLQRRELASGRGIGPFIGAGPINPLPPPPDLPPSIPGTKVTPILTVLQRRELASGRGIGPFIGALPPPAVPIPPSLFSLLFDMVFSVSQGAGEKADWPVLTTHTSNEQTTYSTYLDHRANEQSSPTLQSEHRAGEQSTSPSVVSHGAGEQSSEGVITSHTANESADRSVVLAHGAGEQRDFTIPTAHGGSEQSSPAILGGHLAGEQSSPTLPVEHRANIRVADTIQVEHRAGEQSDQKDPIAYAGAANTNVSDSLLPIAHRATALHSHSVIGEHRAGEQNSTTLAIPRVAALQATETAPIARRIGLISTVVTTVARGIRVVADRLLALAYLGVRRPDPEFTVLLKPSRYRVSIDASTYTAVLKPSRYTVSVD